jgi:CheY-like chemotaxis protein
MSSIQDKYQTLRVLIVEDSLDRLETLRNLYAGHTISAVNDCAAALNCLGTLEFDVIHLDFDLDDETTIPVAEASVLKTSNAIIVIHSDNPDGAKCLKGLLPSAVCVPASLLVGSSPALTRLKGASAKAVRGNKEELKSALARIEII